jgi:glutaredoxin 3
MSNKTVKIYSTPTCHYCHIAKDFFAEKGIKYEDYNVSTDMARRKEMMDKSGQMGVPVIEIGTDIVVGFDQSYISKLLEL